MTAGECLHLTLSVAALIAAGLAAYAVHRTGRGLREAEETLRRLRAIVDEDERREDER